MFLGLLNKSPLPAWGEWFWVWGRVIRQNHRLRRIKLKIMIDYMVRYPSIANSGNRFKHAIRLREHMAAGKPRHRPAIDGHEAIAHLIFRIINMLAAIKFDDQLQFAAGEISDV